MKLILTSSGHFVTEQMPKYLDKKIEEYEIAYITTAGNVAEDKEYMQVRRKRMKELNFNFEEIDIEGKTENELKKLLLSKDIVYVEGGNTFYLLKHTKLSGFDRVVKELVSKGLIYVGSSAGSYLACSTIEMCDWINKKNWDKYGLEDYKGLGLVPFLLRVHFDKYSQEEIAVLKDKIKKCKYEVKTLNDNQALVIENDKVRLVGNNEKL